MAALGHLTNSTIAANQNLLSHIHSSADLVRQQHQLNANYFGNIWRGNHFHAADR